jgi:serine/threonine protein phosphatase PrpC
MSALIVRSNAVACCSLGTSSRFFHSISKPKQQRYRRRKQSRNFKFWVLRGGGPGQDPSTIDMALSRKPIEPLLDQYPVSVSSIRGLRSYMEDDFFIAKPFAAVFDGHGGHAVSQYLRQNLYATLQAELPAVESLNLLKTDGESSTLSAVEDSTLPQTTSILITDYEHAMMRAVEKMDRNVLRISHWSYQGSTVVACWFVLGKILTANVGDSRAVLSRNHQALNLTRDHKPNDPIELARIEHMGGKIVWHGDEDRNGQPIAGTGVWRVNGNLALARAVGDRSERPAVCAIPELSVLDVTEEDDFVILATDGLWDVMSSADAVGFVHALVKQAVKEQDEVTADEMASLLVEEALRRGSYDNITVIVVWLRDYSMDSDTDDDRVRSTTLR